MKINSYSNQNFKGYDAVPLKNLYIQSIKEDAQVEILKELQQIGKNEGFNIKINQDGIIYDDFTSDMNYAKYFRFRWAQDDKHFIRTKEGVFLFLSKPRNHDILLRNSYLMDTTPNTKESEFFISGGNMFIGKKENGEKYMLVGEYDIERMAEERFGENVIHTEENIEEIKDKISKEYEIKKESIHVLPQPNYHLDLAIRPVGYPYILVNDKDTAYKNLIKMFEEEMSETQKRKMTQNALAFYNNEGTFDNYIFKKYADADTIVKELEKAGFIPIRIGGIYARNVNFMNSIVNKHADGTISYITNSTKYGTEEEERLEQIFEEELRRKVPNLRDVYFVSGGKDEKGQANAIMRHLEEYKGGLHCLVTEEPNFETWM